MMIILDFFATLAESASMAYLFYDKEKAGWKRAALGMIMNMITVIAFTYLYIPLELKFYLLFIGQIWLGRYIFKASWNKSVVLAIVYKLAVSVGDLPVQSILSLFTDSKLTLSSGNINFLVPGIIISKLILIFFVLIMKRYFGKIQFHFPKYVLILFVIPSLMLENIALKMEDIMVGATSGFVIHNGVLFAFSILAAVGSILAVLYYYIHVREIEYENNLSYEQLVLKYQYYEEKAENEKKIHSLYHDMREHLLILQELKDEKERKEYTGRLLHEVEEVRLNFQTGNEMIDIILNDKRKVLSENSIELMITGDYRLLNFIENKDMVTLFSNALNNAIEACRHVAGKREIFITLVQRQQFFLWSFENTFEATHSDASELQTTKEDKKLHGWGMKNLEQSVKKYLGDCNHCIKGNRFCLELFFQNIEQRNMQKKGAIA